MFSLKKVLKIKLTVIGFFIFTLPSSHAGPQFFDNMQDITFKLFEHCKQKRTHNLHNLKNRWNNIEEIDIPFDTTLCIVNHICRENDHTFSLFFPATIFHNGGEEFIEICYNYIKQQRNKSLKLLAIQELLEKYMPDED